MEATIEQKLYALAKRVAESASRGSEVSSHVQKTLGWLQDKLLRQTLDASDKQLLADKYTALREADLGIGDHKYTGDLNRAQWMPANFSTWEPDPSEYADMEEE